MKLKSNWLWWGSWLSLSAALAAVLYVLLVSGDDKSAFMPGTLSAGHHQLTQACEACHTDAYGGGAVLHEACIECHGHERKKPFDSHPKAKFTDPRNADRVDRIDVLHCTTCHIEHRPEITQEMGLTQKSDFCFYCHEDIAEDRPSHAGMPFDSCANAGCHNFHDNRALYTDFLIKHLHEPQTKDRAQLPQRELRDVLGEVMTYPHDRHPVKALNAEAVDAPATKRVDNAIVTDWLETAHANGGANCSACHMVQESAEQPPQWTDSPTQEVCATCHDAEVQGFLRGKHGMRLQQGLSAMTPAMALIPMKADAHDRELGCMSCHAAHRFDTKHAAVEACLECHDDQHSRAYKGSPHSRLWESELAGESGPGSGVSCASCHMPRIPFDANDWLRRILVDHNQNATLTPNEKMIRPACLHCHGLEFSINALADESLIANNFLGKPTVDVDTMRLAEQDHQRAEQEREAARSE